MCERNAQAIDHVFCLGAHSDSNCSNLSAWSFRFSRCTLASMRTKGPSRVSSANCSSKEFVFARSVRADFAPIE